jgi:hypothetical protein
MMMPSKAATEPIQNVEPPPLAIAVILGGIALSGAVVFAGSVAIWLIVRNGGVNWMFSTVR